MYIIFSEEEDRQTNEIIDRLRYYDKPVVRYNWEFTREERKDLFKHLTERGLIAGENQVKKKGIVIYHRRPSPYMIDQLLDKEFTEDDIEYPDFKPDSGYFKLLRSNYLAHQSKFFAAVLNNPDWTICRIDYRVNKYEVLVKAEQVGMSIPPTLVSGSKQEVLTFYHTHANSIITKSLYEIMPNYRGEEDILIKCYTQPIEDIANLPTHFFPTLFQKNIEKKYELRVFYLDGDCYSAAIFSQTNEAAQQDFRNADRATPNRIVPYNLGIDLKAQIVDLMELLDLNTGSLDFMVGQNGKIYFLEVNPVGQYGWINTHCNFGISDALAKKMIQIHGE